MLMINIWKIQYLFHKNIIISSTVWNNIYLFYYSCHKTLQAWLLFLKRCLSYIACEFLDYSTNAMNVWLLIKLMICYYCCWVIWPRRPGHSWDIFHRERNLTNIDMSWSRTQNLDVKLALCELSIPSNVN